MSLKHSIIRIFSANFLSMISGVIIGFIIPAVLSIESYSYVKTYAFYISYIGILHFGFIDGMYIKYGGKEVNQIDKGEFKAEHTIFIVMEFVVSLIFILLGIIQKDIIIIMMGLSIIPINSLTFHKMFYQATGQFNDYVKISYLYNITYLVLNIVLVFILRSTNYIYYCLISLVSNAIVYIILEVKFYKNTRDVVAKYSMKLFNNIKVGFFMLIGNFAVILFYAIDRWFIKIFLSVNDFAYYSFAVSMLNVINLLVSAISVTFYNYLSKGENEFKIKKIKKYCLILGSFSSLGYFALAGIVSLFLKKYIPSLNIIAISFAAYPYMIMINAVYINLYKARKDEKKYLRIVLYILSISIIYNFVAIIVGKSAEAIAVATTLSFITWYFYSMKDFKYLKSNKRELIFLSITLIGFLIFSNYFNWFIGGILYLLLFIILSFITYKKEIYEIIEIVLKKN